MTAQKTIWTITGLFVVLAIITAAFQRESEPEIPGTSLAASIEERDRLIDEMSMALERDWRVRRKNTQQLVEAVAVYAQHPELNTPETIFALGLLRYYKLRDVDGAEQAYLKALGADPDWAWPWDKLGVLYYTLGDRLQGISALNKAMKLAPKWSRPHSDMAILFRLDDDLDKAMAEAETALKMEPGNPITRFNYAVITDYQGRILEARELYLEILEMDRELPAPYYNLACGYAREGNVTQAIYYLNEAITLDIEFRSEAINDPDFDLIREEPDFFDFMLASSPR